MPFKEWRTIAFGLVCLWAMGFVTVAFQGVFAVYRLGIHRRSSVRYSLDALDLAELAAKVGLKRRWELRVSETSNLGSAMTWGNRNPVVLLPQASVSWPKNRLEVVLLHELAHVRRRDSLTQMLAFIVCALYWFNPAVWLCSRAMRAEAELAADDVVLLCGIRPSFYAGELLRFASKLGQKSRPFHPIGIAFMKHPKIEKRIRSIIDPACSRFRVKLIHVLTAVAIGAFGVLALASLRPTVPILSQTAPSSADSYSPLQKTSGPAGKRRAPAPDRGNADLPAYRASSDSRERQIPEAHGSLDSLRRSTSADEFIAPESDVFANAEPALKKSRTTDGAGADSPPASADSLPRSKPGLPRISTQREPESPDNNTPPSESEDSLPTNR
jgi:beta-lactamase regulating signal transducer with metallopeptidase domain